MTLVDRAEPRQPGRSVNSTPGSAVFSARSFNCRAVDAMTNGPYASSAAVSSGAAVGDGAGSLRTIIDLAPIGLAQFDSAGRFPGVNDRRCHILGCSRDDLVASTLTAFTIRLP